jgi:predicted RNA-binding protein YlqC (UPF0109 family)
MPTASTGLIESLLRDIAAAIVRHPDRLRVERREPIAGEVLWWMSCAPEDQGKLIGRGGSHARAFDLLVAAMGQGDGEEWKFKLDRVPGVSTQDSPTQPPKHHDARAAHELLARILAQLPVGGLTIESPRLSGPMCFHFDLKTTAAASFFERRDPDDPESNLIGALGTLFRAAARKVGVRYQINVVPS